MTSRTSRRRIILGLTITIILLVAALQPYFLGNATYFGIDARLICCPIAFVILPLLGLHIYLNWNLLKSMFKPRSGKTVRMIVFTAMLITGILDISSGWRSAIAGKSEYMVMPMWAWSWLFTILIAAHVWLHRQAFTKYFLKNKKLKNSGIPSDSPGT